MIKFFKNHRKEIFISLGTGLVLFIAQPILSFLGQKFVSFAISISDSFSNRFYTKLAQKDLNELDNTSSTMLYLLFVNIYIFIIYFTYMKRNNARRLIRKRQKQIESSKNKFARIREIITATDQNSEKQIKADVAKELPALESSISDAENFLENYEKSLNRINKFSTVLNTLIVLLIIVTFFVNSQITQRKLMVIKYLNKTEAMKPFVEQNIIDKFNSDWVLIRNRSDYEKLIGQVDKKLSENNIKF